jgi:hypothetical protein
LKQQKLFKGDFVKLKSNSLERCGIIVDVQKTNTTSSKHAQHAMSSYPNVYYILVNEAVIEGPYFYDELLRVN